MTIVTAVGFVESVRRGGIAVSLGSSRLFAEALAEIDLGNPDEVYWAARAVLVRRPEDIELFNGLFVAYWGGVHSGHLWRPPQDPSPVTLLLDDPEQTPSDGVEEGDDNDDSITVRYCVTETLAQKDFADYSEEELAESRRLMEEILFMGSCRRSRRRVSSRRARGALDIRRTVRQALRSGGEPTEIARAVPGSRPRRLVLLLDVSGSMEPYARALIGFVHAAVASGARVEAFTLGTRLTRLTRELSQRDPDRALQAASLAVKDWSGGTRLGEGLGRFNDEWGCRGTARGATIVILSDGWDRGDPEEMEIQMQRLARVAHRVVWVNPLKASPGYAPLARAMAAALPFVDDFVEGHCLDSLHELARLVLGGSEGRFREESRAARPGPEPDLKHSERDLAPSGLGSQR